MFFLHLRNKNVRGEFWERCEWFAEVLSSLFHTRWELLFSVSLALMFFYSLRMSNLGRLLNSMWLSGEENGRRVRSVWKFKGIWCRFHVTAEINPLGQSPGLWGWLFPSNLTSVCDSVLSVSASPFLPLLLLLLPWHAFFVLIILLIFLSHFPSQFPALLSPRSHPFSLHLSRRRKLFFQTWLYLSHWKLWASIRANRSWQRGQISQKMEEV